MLFHFGRAFDVVDEAFFISDMLSTLSARHFSLPTCFRRCRRGIFHFGCAIDVVDEAFFISDVLSTLSTRHFSLPTCFRRCRRGILSLPTRNPVTISGFLILRVWFCRLFRIIWSFPPPSSPPPRGCCRDGGGERISKTEVRPRGWGLFPPRLRRRNIRLWRRPR